MKAKVLVIVFCAFIFSFLIYSIFADDRLYVLSVGDELSLGETPFNSYGKSYNVLLKDHLERNKVLGFYNDYFSSEGETYESINYKFDDDYYVTIKNEKVSLRKSIADSDVIIVSLSNAKTFKKCDLSKDNFIKYMDNNFELINKFATNVKRISDTKIVILGNYCFKFVEEINQHIVNMSNDLLDNVYYINLYDGIHLKTFFLPNSKHLYPSIEGYYYIFDQIKESYDFLKS